MRAETGSSRPSVWDDRPRIDKAGQNRRSDGWKQYGVRYDLVVALIEKESGYKFDKVGDDGHSIGYMQIYEECHRDRMERLNVTDLTNPYQNVLVGIDYLSELIERYGTIQDALAAYNYGEQGAKQHGCQGGSERVSLRCTVFPCPSVSLRLQNAVCLHTNPL